jgi:FtsZ-interacting cell division protein ZipA
MQDGSITFYPTQQPPLKTWQIVVGSIVFVILIIGIVWRLRRRSQKTPGSLNIDGH